MKEYKILPPPPACMIPLILTHPPTNQLPTQTTVTHPITATHQIIQSINLYGVHSPEGGHCLAPAAIRATTTTTFMECTHPRGGHCLAPAAFRATTTSRWPSSLAQ